MIDLDHLKFVNDHLGHEAGNRALRGLAQCLKKNLREVDFAARYGGDEFTVLMAHQTPEEAAIFANRLRDDLREIPRGEIQGKKMDPTPLTLSVGIAGHEPLRRQPSPEHLLERADVALYRAKSLGRDQIAIDLDPNEPSDAVNGHT
jgi:two-component system, cell cycle response regulator